MVGDALERCGCPAGLLEGEFTSLELVVRHLVGVISLLRVKEVVQAVVVLGDVEGVEAIIEAKARVKARVLHVAVHVVGVEASRALWTALCGTTVRLQAPVPR